MSDPRFEAFKELLLNYAKAVEVMERANPGVATLGWPSAAYAETRARLALYGAFTEALAAPVESATDPLAWSCPACEDLCWGQISERNVKVGLHHWCPQHIAMVRPASPRSPAEEAP